MLKTNIVCFSSSSFKDTILPLSKKIRIVDASATGRKRAAIDEMKNVVNKCCQFMADADLFI